jgi:Raf kinase inhibitor-like YbhB/YbcL family protein
MQISSPDFKEGEAIPKHYTCDGEDTSPNLEISDVPPETKSLTIIMDDPDSPSGTWVHWTLWNIDPTCDKIQSGSAPVDSKEGMTSFGRSGYGGPCPHSGTHHYYFKLYALDIELDLPQTTKVEELMEAMEGHMLAEAELIGLYTREKE